MDDDDRPHVTPLDAVEFAHTMSAIAAGAASLLSALIEEGMSEERAVETMLAYVHGLAGGKFNA